MSVIQSSAVTYILRKLSQKAVGFVVLSQKATPQDPPTQYNKLLIAWLVCCSEI